MGEPKKPYLAAAPESARCAADSRSGERCRNVRVNGSDYCHKHGGYGVRGHPNRLLFSGIRFRVRDHKHLLKLPRGLDVMYEEALADPELLSLRPGLALVEVRLRQQVEGLEPGTSNDIWKELQDLAFSVRQLQDEVTDPRLDGALDCLLGAIDRGARQQDQWNDIMDTLDKKRELSTAETKRLVDMRQMMPGSQLFVIVAAVCDVIMKNVKGAELRTKIADEIQQIVGGKGRVLHWTPKPNPVAVPVHDEGGLLDDPPVSGTHDHHDHEDDPAP